MAKGMNTGTTQLKAIIKSQHNWLWYKNDHFCWSDITSQSSGKHFWASGSALKHKWKASAKNQSQKYTQTHLGFPLWQIHSRGPLNNVSSLWWSIFMSVFSPRLLWTSLSSIILPFLVKQHLLIDFSLTPFVWCSYRSPTSLPLFICSFPFFFL